MVGFKIPPVISSVTCRTPRSGLGLAKRTRFQHPPNRLPAPERRGTPDEHPVDAGPPHGLIGHHADPYTTHWNMAI